MKNSGIYVWLVHGFTSVPLPLDDTIAASNESALGRVSTATAASGLPGSLHERVCQNPSLEPFQRAAVSNTFPHFSFSPYHGLVGSSVHRFTAVPSVRTALWLRTEAKPGEMEVSLAKPVATQTFLLRVPPSCLRIWVI